MSLVNKTKLFLSKVVPIRELTNEELMELVAGNSKEAYEMLYTRYNKPIFNYVRSIVYSESMAEEVAHEVFLKVYQKREQYNSSYKFTTWLWRIARNTSIDSLKRKDAMNYKSDIGRADCSLTVEDIHKDTVTPEMNLIDKSLGENIQKCLGHLKERQKEAIIMRIFSELSYDEISETLEVTLASVKTLINRARTALAACLNKVFENER